MDVLAGLLLEILFEGLLSGVFDALGRFVARVIRVSAVRVALLVGLIAAVGIGGGYAWGRYASEQLDGRTPRTLWVSLAAAVIALIAAVGTYRSPDHRFAASPGREPRSWPQRLVALGAFNLVTAVGIAWGTSSV